MTISLIKEKLQLCLISVYLLPLASIVSYESGFHVNLEMGKFFFQITYV